MKERLGLPMTGFPQREGDFRVCFRQMVDPVSCPSDLDLEKVLPGPVLMRLPVEIVHKGCADIDSGLPETRECFREEFIHVAAKLPDFLAIQMLAIGRVVVPGKVPGEMAIAFTDPIPVGGWQGGAEGSGRGKGKASRLGMMSDNVTKTGEFLRGVPALLVVDLEGNSLKRGKVKASKNRLEKVEKDNRQWEGVVIDGPGAAVERQEMHPSCMDLDDPFQRKPTKPVKNGGDVDGAIRSGKVGQAMSEVQTDGKGRPLGKDPEKIAQVHPSRGMGGKGGSLDQKKSSLHGLQESQRPLPGDLGPLGGQKGGGIKTKVKPFHGFLCTFVDHPGGPESLHVPTGPPLLLPELRIGRIAWLGVPQAVPMIGQGKGRRKLGPEFLKVDGPSPEDFKIVRGRFFQVRDELGNGRKIKIGGESCKGSVAGSDQGHDISLRSQGVTVVSFRGGGGGDECPGLLPGEPTFLPMISDHRNKCPVEGFL